MLRVLFFLLAGALAASGLGACGRSDDRAGVGDAKRGAGSGPGATPVSATPVDDVPRRVPLVERLLIVGLDGATWQLLDPLLAAGELPHLDRLIRSGARMALQTMEPTLSPAIWTTIATGFLPEQHGILGFDGVPGQTMTTLPNATMRQRKTFWNILSDFGVATGTVGWWASWPADPLADGSFLISDRVPYSRMEAAIGRASLDDGDIQPAALQGIVTPLVERPDDIDPDVLERFLLLDTPELRQRFLDVGYEMGRFLPEFKFVYQSDRSTVRMALAALESYPVDVLSVYLTGIDTVSHLYWHFAFPDQFPAYEIAAGDVQRFSNVIRLYYRQVDEWLGQLVEAAGEGATVLVVSDHGFGPTGQLPWSGGHGRITPGAPVAPDGVWVLSGPGAAAGTQPGRAHVLDVTPTVLHLMGLPVAVDQLGQVRAEVLAPGLRDELPRIESYERIGSVRGTVDGAADPAGDAERLERLRALGYIQ
ncbi:MAG: hypothetical protein DHS20C21_20110 [Gemmatimonadota bacterium]|nr:MAG: hypothetical protein DHS20C21_20110 [Gemmatimonadota bacterium]